MNRLYEELILEQQYNIMSASTRENVIKKIVEDEMLKIVVASISPSQEDYALALVGKRENLAAHILEFSNIDIKNEKLIVVERDKDIYDGLIEEKSERNYKCEIRFGDYFKILEDVLAEGKSIYIADFDGTSKISSIQQTVKSINYFKENRIKIFRIVASARADDRANKEKFFEDFGMKKIYKPVFLSAENLRNVKKTLEEKFEKSKKGSE